MEKVGSQHRFRKQVIILAGIVETSETELPDRTVVPLDITYGEDQITIVSPEDNVNTSLAEHDIFKGDIRNFNRFVYVDSGTTVITYSYPYLWQSALMSFGGVVVIGIMVIYLKRKSAREKSRSAET